MPHEVIEMDEMIILVGLVVMIFGANAVGIGFVIFGIALHFLTHASHHEKHLH